MHWRSQKTMEATKGGTNVRERKGKVREDCSLVVSKVIVVKAESGAKKKSGGGAADSLEESRRLRNLETQEKIGG